MGLRQQLRVVLFQPHQLIQGIERKRADAGYLLQLTRGHILADILHHRRGARAFPADDRIQQGALLIHQRAIDAKGRDGDAAHRAGGQLVMDLPTAVGKALHNGLQRPLVPVAFSAAMSLAFAVAARAIMFPCRSTAIARTFVAPQSRTRITSCFIVTPETTLPDGAALIRPTDRARL